MCLDLWWPRRYGDQIKPFSNSRVSKTKDVSRILRVHLTCLPTKLRKTPGKRKVKDQQATVKEQAGLGQDSGARAQAVGGIRAEGRDCPGGLGERHVGREWVWAECVMCGGSC